MPLHPHLDALIEDYNARIDVLRKVIADAKKARKNKISELEKKTNAEIDRLEQQRKDLEKKWVKKEEKFYEEFKSKKVELENIIRREKKHAGDWDAKLKKAAEELAKLKGNNAERLGEHDKKLAELKGELAEAEERYNEIIELLKKLDGESRVNYSALCNMPAMDIDNLTFESADRLSAFSNKILWFQLQTIHEIYKLSYEKLALEESLKQMRKKLDAAGKARDKAQGRGEAELKEPLAAVEYNRRNVKKYEAKVQEAEQELARYMASEAKFKAEYKVETKQTHTNIDELIAKLRTKLPAKRKKIEQEHDEIIVKSEAIIRRLEAQLKKAETWESQLKERLDELEAPTEATNKAVVKASKQKVKVAREEPEVRTVATTQKKAVEAKAAQQTVVKSSSSSTKTTVTRASGQQVTVSESSSIRESSSKKKKAVKAEN